MKNTLHSAKTLAYAFCAVIMLSFIAFSASAQRLPYEIVNNSEFSDNEVFVAIVGEELGGGKHIWVDAASGQVNRMDRSNNTVPGPQIDGNPGPGLDGRYADCFRRLSEIPNKTVQIPQIAGCRILISFKSQMYLYFFGYDGSPRGYAGANLANSTDPNQGIIHEVIELTYNEFGVFNNTSRVDAFQYPIGLEVTGQGFFKKVGELKSKAEIFARWEQQVPAPFQQLLNREKGVIIFPTKNESFPKDYLDGYINAIWNKYRSQEIYFNSGDAGRWRGSVQGNNFVVRRESDGQIATIPGKPTTLEAMEGSGVMASGQRWDLVVQAQFVAAITRHAIDLNTDSGQFQDFGDASKYYKTEPYNWYSKFLHQTDISFEGQTYTFAYDDVFDQSATISTRNPIRAKITLGPINGGGATTPPTTGDITTWTSSNINGSIIRHQNSRGRIDANVTPAQAGQWRMVAGLAGRGVSFQSVNFPNRYLRHRNGEVWLDPIQNNNLYRADASFIERPGLSNAEQTSFEASNFSGRFLRHRGSLLFVEAVNSDLGRRDATFSKIGEGTNNPTTPGTTRQIEAERFTAQNGIETEPCSEGGENVGFTDEGDFLAYADINFPTTGSYLIEYRVASAIGGGRISSDLNAGTIPLGAVNIPNTGGWQTWRTVSQTVNINAGTYQFGIFSITGGWNMNWIRITPQGGAKAAIDKTLENTLIYPNPTTDSITIESDSKEISVAIFDIQGRKIQETGSIVSGSSVSLTELPKGMYLVQVLHNNTVAIHKVLKN